MARLRNVHTANVALSDTPGTSVLRMAPNVGASYVSGKQDEPWPTHRVDLVRLDDALLAVDRLDFIHLDAEGMEPRILAGSERLIRTFKPTLMVEVTDQWLQRYGSSAKALLQQIAGLGYFTLLKLQPNPAQFDVVAMPLERVSQLPDPVREAVYAG